MISISLEITTFLKKGSSFAFPKKDNNHGKSSISLNEGFVITDRETYNAYNWPSPEDFSTDGLKRMADYLPDGMKIIIFSPDGILENVIRLIGYENLCYLLYDEPDVVSDVFEQVGSRIYRYYKTAIDLDCVGGIIYNDDCSRSSLTRYDFQYVMIFSSQSLTAQRSNAHMRQTKIESI